MSCRPLIVVPITKSYMEEGSVFLNSVRKTNPSIPVHVITHDLTDEDFKEWENVTKVVIEPPCDTEFRRVRTSRFRYAMDIKDEFNVVGLFDADMCLLRDINKFFKMAETGTILACSNNTLLRYIKKDFDAMQVDVNPRIDVVHPTFSTVPIFVNASLNEEWLTAIWENPTGNDLDIPNLYAESLRLMDKVFLLNSYAWTNIHHTMIKPETFARKTHNGLYSHQGEPVYCLHGHLGDPAYLKELIEPMKKNYGYYPKYVESAENCVKVLKETYDTYK